MKSPEVLQSFHALTGWIVSYSKGKADWLAENTTNLVFSILSTLLTVVLVFTVSVFLYGTFYYAYVPIDVYKVPLDLQFEPCNETRLKCSYPRDGCKVFLLSEGGDYILPIVGI